MPSAKVNPNEMNPSQRRGKSRLKSYEDLLIEQYIQQMDHSQDRDASSYPSPYRQRMSRSVNNLYVDPSNPGFWLDPTWDDEENRPAPAPRPHSSYTVRTQSRRLARSSSVNLIRVLAYPNGSREHGVRLTAATMHALLLSATARLGLPRAARKLFLSDGSEVEGASVPPDTEVFVSCGEPFQDPQKAVKEFLRQRREAHWTLDGVKLPKSKSQSRVKVSKRVKELAGRGKRRILVFENGCRDGGIEVAVSSLQEALDASSARWGRIKFLLGWNGRAINDLSEAPQLCLEPPGDGTSTAPLGPVWASRGEALAVRNARSYFDALLHETRKRSQAVVQWKQCLETAAKGDKVDDVRVHSLTHKELQQEQKRAQDGLGHLKAVRRQVKDILDALPADDEPGAQHIPRIKDKSRLWSTPTLRLKVSLNGSLSDPVSVSVTKKKKNDSHSATDLFADECARVLSLRRRPQRFFTTDGVEVKDLRRLETDTHVRLSFGESFRSGKAHFLSLELRSVVKVEVDGGRRVVVAVESREPLPTSAVSRGRWLPRTGIPGQFPARTLGGDDADAQQLSSLLETQSVDEQGFFLQLEGQKEAVLHPQVGVREDDALEWRIEQSGLISCRAFPEACLSALEPAPDEKLVVSIEGQAVREPAVAVGVSARAPLDARQQWRFDVDGLMSNNAMATLFLTSVDVLEDNRHRGVCTSLALCPRLTGSQSSRQRFGIKQTGLNQWRLCWTPNPAWRKQALSWPIRQDGSWNPALEWPMHGLLLCNAPPFVRDEAPLGGPLRLRILKNGERDSGRAVAVVAPAGDDEQLQLVQMLERCTVALALPSAARYVFDASGALLASLAGLHRDQLVYVSCGEAFADPQLSQQEQARRRLLASLQQDLSSLRLFCLLRAPAELVLSAEAAHAGARLRLDKCALNAQQRERIVHGEDAHEVVHDDSASPSPPPMAASAHDRAHHRQRQQPLDWQWERLVNATTGEQIAEQSAPSARLLPASLALQKFRLDEDGFLALDDSPDLVLSMRGEGRVREAVLDKRMSDDPEQRWTLHEGFLLARHLTHMALTVQLPSVDDNATSVRGCAVNVQQRRVGGCSNQKWRMETQTRLVVAMQGSAREREVCAANRAGVCTTSVSGDQPLQQEGFVLDGHIRACCACARALRGRFRLSRVSEESFSCQSARLSGFRGPLLCLNGKVDLSESEADNTLAQWDKHYDQLRRQSSVRAISQGISAMPSVRVVRVVAFRNGERRTQSGELLVGSSVGGLLQQATRRLSMTSAARKMFMADGTPVLELSELVRRASEWAHEQMQASELRVAESELQELLSSPIEVFVSAGEPFVPPDGECAGMRPTAVAEVAERVQRQASEWSARQRGEHELEQAKHALRQMTGRRIREQDPGELRAQNDPAQPVRREGHWNAITFEERVQHYKIQLLQRQLDELRSRDKTERTGGTPSRKLYQQPNTKRVRVYANGSRAEQAVSVRANSLQELMDMAELRLGLGKRARTLFSSDGQRLFQFEELQQEQLVCVSTSSHFVGASDLRRQRQIRAAWARADQNDVALSSTPNPRINVDPFAPALPE